MKSFVIGIMVCSVIFITGCNDSKGGFLLWPSRAHLALDFNEGEALRYRFISDKTIVTDYNYADRRVGKAGNVHVNEALDMIVRYEPFEVDPCGIAKINVYFESVNTVTSSPVRRDAIETLSGKTFAVTIGPDGKIHDKTQLINIIREAGSASFRKSLLNSDPNIASSIKDPDLVEDFTAIQWFLWDSLSSMEQAEEGLSVGQKWKSSLPVPTSIFIRPVREVTYKLSNIKRAPQGRIAVINSTYKHTNIVPEDWPPYPWPRGFTLTGQIGVLMHVFQGLFVISLEGHGQELFNLDLGRIESSEQEYKVVFRPNSIPMPNADPYITLKQKVTVQLLED